MCTFDECGPTARRSFLVRSLTLAVAALAGVRAQAARLRTEANEVTFPTSVGDVRGYIATPLAYRPQAAATARARCLTFLAESLAESGRAPAGGATK